MSSPAQSPLYSATFCSLLVAISLPSFSSSVDDQLTDSADVSSSAVAVVAPFCRSVGQSLSVGQILPLRPSVLLLLLSKLRGQFPHITLVSAAAKVPSAS